MSSSVNRLKHVDELLEHAQAGAAQTGGAAFEHMADVKRERDRLSGRV